MSMVGERTLAVGRLPSVMNDNSCPPRFRFVLWSQVCYSMRPILAYARQTASSFAVASPGPFGPVILDQQPLSELGSIFPAPP